MKVILASRARRDLQEIGDWIARDDMDRADTFVAELIEAAHGIASYPRRFPLIPRYELSGIRRRVHGNYLILYHIATDHVTVLRFAHGARDIDALLLPEGEP